MTGHHRALIHASMTRRSKIVTTWHIERKNVFPRFKNNVASVRTISGALSGVVMRGVAPEDVAAHVEDHSPKQQPIGWFRKIFMTPPDEVSQDKIAFVARYLGLQVLAEKEAHMLEYDMPFFNDVDANWGMVYRHMLDFRHDWFRNNDIEQMDILSIQNWSPLNVGINSVDKAWNPKMKLMRHKVSPAIMMMNVRYSKFVDKNSEDTSDPINVVELSNAVSAIGIWLSSHGLLKDVVETLARLNNSYDTTDEYAIQALAQYGEENAALALNLHMVLALQEAIRKTEIDTTLPWEWQSPLIAQSFLKCVDNGAALQQMFDDLGLLFVEEERHVLRRR